METMKQETSGEFSGGVGGSSTDRAPCMDDYNLLNRLGKGVYGVVYKAENKATGEIVAIKKSKLLWNEHDEDPELRIPFTTMREIDSLSRLRHPAIVEFKGKFLTEKSICIVMEYMDRNLREYLDVIGRPLNEAKAKRLVFQLIDATAYVHAAGYMHRDLKLENLLLSQDRKRLKICDFGLSRPWNRTDSKPLTVGMVAQTYRSPELLLGTDRYTSAVDVFGCIMGELLLNRPLFSGKTQISTLHSIFQLLGCPEKSFPGLLDLAKEKGVILRKNAPPFSTLKLKFRRLSEEGYELLGQMLDCNPVTRISAEEALHHEWFADIDWDWDDIYSS